MSAIYRDSLRVMCDGPFVEDWEFQTLMGISRAEMRELYENWREPVTDEALSAAGSALNNLLGYPHGKMTKAEEMMGASKEEMLTALNQIPGQVFR